MPFGNLFGSATRLPDASRLVVDQQSSRLTYWYPAAAIPLETMASAVRRMIVSLIPQPKLFQALQPSCGVLPRPFARAEAGPETFRTATGTAARAATATREMIFVDRRTGELQGYARGAGRWSV